MVSRHDPLGAFNFLVEIDGITQANFSEVSGLSVEITPIDYRDGGDATTVRKLPGLRKYTNITLKRGYTSDRSLWDWMQTVISGQVKRASMSITLLDQSRQPVLRWTVREAWPCKYQGPSLRAEATDVAIETVEICHEGIELVE
jgi:phage tail-like protein